MIFNDIHYIMPIGIFNSCFFFNIFKKSIFLFRYNKRIPIIFHKFINESSMFECVKKIIRFVFYFFFLFSNYRVKPFHIFISLFLQIFCNFCISTFFIIFTLYTINNVGDSCSTVFTECYMIASNMFLFGRVAIFDITIISARQICMLSVFNFFNRFRVCNNKCSEHYRLTFIFPLMNISYKSDCKF